jgi:CubicO group peptidase (beta-lactamase class C family)
LAISRLVKIQGFRPNGVYLKAFKLRGIMKTINFLLLVFGCVCLTSANASERASLRHLKGVEKVIMEAMQDFEVPGIALGIVKDDQIVFTGGFGYRDLEQQLPVTKDTLFGIGSLTKAFTALLIGQLVEADLLKWEDPVVMHLPEFGVHDSYASAHLTIKDLLSHVTGMAPHDVLWFTPDLTRSSLLHSLHSLSPDCSLRQKFIYNNLMFNVAGSVIESVLQMPWQQAVAEKIFTPLSMLASNCSVETTRNSADYSLPYEELDGTVQAVPFLQIEAGAPAGGIFSNVTDLMKWMQLHLRSGSFKEQHLIAAHLLDEMHRPQSVFQEGSPTDGIFRFGYGLGWFIGIYKGHYFIEHHGVINGFAAHVSLLPKEKIGIILLSNRGKHGMQLLPALAHDLMGHMLGNREWECLEKTRREIE